MQELFALLGLEAWKPVLTALLLPPVPLLLLALLGARLILRRRGLGWLAVLAAVTLLYATSLSGVAVVMQDQWLRPPAALTPERLAELRSAPRGTAIVVLGGGRRPYAPEYGVADLEPPSLERLRYGAWLARQTGAPLAFTGGVGWAARDRQSVGAAEAEIAARVARQEFGVPLKWVEANARDTRENAILMAPMLRQDGVRHVVLVTHAWHMPRALREFRAHAGSDLRVEAAPMGYLTLFGTVAEDWLPTGRGMLNVRSVLREILAGLAGT